MDAFLTSLKVLQHHPLSGLGEQRLTGTEQRGACGTGLGTTGHLPLVDAFHARLVAHLALVDLAEGVVVVNTATAEVEDALDHNYANNESSDSNTVALFISRFE